MKIKMLYTRQRMSNNPELRFTREWLVLLRLLALHSKAGASRAPVIHVRGLNLFDHKSRATFFVVLYSL